MIAKVVINRKTEKLDKLFSYHIPQDLEPHIKKGDIVQIIFANKLTFGVVIDISNDEGDIKNLSEIKKIEKTSILNEAFFNTYEYMKSRTNLASNVLLLSLIPNNFFKLRPITNNSKNLKFKLSSNGAKLVFNPNQFIDKIEYIKNSISKYEQIIITSSDYHLLDKYYNELKEFNPFINHPYTGEKKQNEAINSYFNNKGIIITQKELLFFDNKFSKLIILDDINVGSNEYEKLSFSLIDLLKYKQAFNQFDLIYFSNPSLEFIHLFSDEIKVIRNDFLTPAPEVINIREQFNKYSIADDIINIIKSSLAAGEQVVVYNARVNYSLYLFCRHCKKIIRCNNCQKALKYSESKQIVFCPSCHKQYSYLDNCPYCSEKSINYYGYGLEYTYSELKKLFPDQKILLMDGSYPKLKKLNTKEFNIIVGSKGINKFLNLKLNTRYILLNIDLDLALNQYNSLEQSYQLINRFQRQSSYPVVIQSEHNYSFFYSFLNKDYFEFSQFELDNRKNLLLPPVVNNYQIIYSANSDSYLLTYKKAKKIITLLNNYNYIGPSELFLDNGYNYNFVITIKDNNLDIKKIKDLLSNIELRKEEGIRIYSSPEIY